MENINQRILKEEENQRYLEERVSQLMKEMEDL
jgi:hypothetical protein